jgi:MFS family permease
MENHGSTTSSTTSRTQSPFEERDDTSSDRELSIIHTGVQQTNTNRHSTLSRTPSIAEELSPLHEFFFIGLLCSAQLTTQMALVGPLSILHIIGRGLNITNPGVLAWLIAGYSLTVGSFILLSGRLGDVFGYKKMIVIGYVWFAVWSLVGGLSVWSGEVLFIFSRVLAGIGPAILLPNSLGLLGATYRPGKKKNMVFSLFGGCAPSKLYSLCSGVCQTFDLVPCSWGKDQHTDENTAGAIVGGAFAGLWSLIWWPWAFFTFAIALFCLAILSMLILPSPPPKAEFAGLSLKQKIVDLDLLGASVGLTAMILFNFAWNQAPGFGWEQVYIYVLLIIGILLFPVFFWIEIKVATKPLIPFDALSTDVSFVLGCVACGWASFGMCKPHSLTFPFFLPLDEKLTTNRHLGILLLPISTTATRRHTPPFHRHGSPPHHSRRCSRTHRWKVSRSYRSLMGHVLFHACLSHWEYSHCHRTRATDILGTNIRLHADRAVGNGHVFSCRNAYHE